MTDAPPPMELSYESAIPEPLGPRPKWVWAIVIIYLLLVATVLLLPLWMALAGDSDSIVAGAVIATVVALCGLGLIFTPVRIARRRRITRRSIWIPLLASGFLLGLIFTTTGWAVMEYLKSEVLAYAWIGGILVWIFWSVVIWLMTRTSDPNSLAAKLHHWVFGGSVAELLVAVPCHIAVRRRNECCAGMATGTAICVGCVVMLLSFGPSVVFLYYRRWKQITGRS